MNGAKLVFGQVMHQRLRPAPRRFVYRVFCLRLDIDQLDSLNNALFGVNRWRVLGINTRDYGARDDTPLSSWIRQLLTTEGLPADGRIWLQTFPRMFGYVFNPVSFWYCHDAAGGLRAVLAEVNNTFGEHHRYLLTAPDNAPITPQTTLTCRKQLHVSPFCQVQGHYEFRLRECENTVFTAIDYHDAQGLLIRTAIGGHAVPFSVRNLGRALLTHPLLTVGVGVRIHWQALKLWLGKVPFHQKPAPPQHSLTLAHHEEIKS
ncbi:DUF1365 domain-containing protein [Silvimonas sp.]|uniref:DUF1365 domain-containing protein n=1 Tax=Silvimonas sp. TaxID=2650811 RepID=UPI00283CBBB0|nr:DUF1365 domain-containing protein [Silvimonas sp.]MDR3427540.1 DUF1365 domain-containing protein [Silvimonas sp.]